MKLLKTIGAATLAFGVLAGVCDKKTNLLMSRFYVPVQENQVVETQTEVLEIFPVYALKNTHIFYNNTLLSGAVEDIQLGKKLYASNLQDGFYTVSSGVLREQDFTTDKRYVFYPVDRIKFAISGARGLDDIDGNVLTTYSLNDMIHVIGKNDFGYYLTEQNEYIKATDVMNTRYTEPTPIAVYEPEPAVTVYTPPTGTGYLTPSAGVFYGPSGKETYYNLPMGGVIAIAQAAGIQGNYWERSDGAKMYGNYIICACGFDVRPRGTLVETSLGTGICLDTGTFAYSDPYQVDLAVNW